MLHFDYKYDRLSIQINVKIGGMSLWGERNGGHRVERKVMHCHMLISKEQSCVCTGLYPARGSRMIPAAPRRWNRVESEAIAVPVNAKPVSPVATSTSAFKFSLSQTFHMITLGGDRCNVFNHVFFFSIVGVLTLVITGLSLCGCQLINIPSCCIS